MNDANYEIERFTDKSDDELDSILRQLQRDFCVIKNWVDFCDIKIGLIFVTGHKNRADFCAKEIVN